MKTIQELIERLFQMCETGDMTPEAAISLLATAIEGPSQLKRIIDYVETQS